MHNTCPDARALAMGIQIADLPAAEFIAIMTTIELMIARPGMSRAEVFETFALLKDAAALVTGQTGTTASTTGQQ